MESIPSMNENILVFFDNAKDFGDLMWREPVVFRETYRDKPKFCLEIITGNMDMGRLARFPWQRPKGSGLYFKCYSRKVSAGGGIIDF